MIRCGEEQRPPGWQLEEEAKLGHGRCLITSPAIGLMDRVI